MPPRFVCPKCGAPLHILEECYRPIEPDTGRVTTGTTHRRALKVECSQCYHIVTKQDMPDLWKRNPRYLS